jgi:DNA-nicking Smr family endonuclease
VRPKTPFHVPAEDIELFRKTVGTVKPLRHDRYVPASPRRRPVRARFAWEDRLALAEESLTGARGDAPVASGDALSHRRPDVPDGVLRKLRRGEYAVEGEIDLHGLTEAQAKRALHGFLATSLARHLRCVSVIHGKGLRSGNDGPVLKRLVNDMLRRTPAILAYVSARPADGGTGAVYVLLSSS